MCKNDEDITTRTMERTKDERRYGDDGLQLNSMRSKPVCDAGWSGESAVLVVAGSKSVMNGNGEEG